MCNISTFKYYLLICLFRVAIHHCDGVSIFGGNFQKNKRMDSIPIFSMDNMGIRMCLREGMRVKSCNGVNYWKDGLQCTLLSVSVGNNLIESPGHVYTDLDSWTMVSNKGCSYLNLYL